MVTPLGFLNLNFTPPPPPAVEKKGLLLKISVELFPDNRGSTNAKDVVHLCLLRQYKTVCFSLMAKIMIHFFCFSLIAKIMIHFFKWVTMNKTSVSRLYFPKK